jgi:hypothetical protein
MLIQGRWANGEDGVVRPVVIGELLAADGSWFATEFLIDIGADCTVIMDTVLHATKLPYAPAPFQLGGVGGSTTTVSVSTQIRFALQNGDRLIIDGKLAGFTKPGAIDTNVLGRDIMNLFAVIVDKPGNSVWLVGKGHRYSIAKDA